MKASMLVLMVCMIAAAMADPTTSEGLQSETAKLEAATTPLINTYGLDQQLSINKPIQTMEESKEFKENLYFNPAAIQPKPVGVAGVADELSSYSQQKIVEAKPELKELKELKEFKEEKIVGGGELNKVLGEQFKEAKVVGGEESMKEEKVMGWAEQLEQARLTGSPLAPVLSLSSQRIEQHPMLSFETARLVAAKTPPAPQPIVKPKNAPVMASKLENAQWTMVQQPITQKRQQLPVIELAPILQPYTVHSTTFQTENIKQPITEPVFQPYLQRFVQQAQPVVQPIVQRITQPIVHREVHSYLQTKNERAPDADTIVKPTEFQLQTNQAIRGGDLAALPISKGKSHST